MSERSEAASSETVGCGGFRAGAVSIARAAIVGAVVCGLLSAILFSATNSEGGISGSLIVNAAAGAAVFGWSAYTRRPAR